MRRHGDSPPRLSSLDVSEHTLAPTCYYSLPPPPALLPLLRLLSSIPRQFSCGHPASWTRWTTPVVGQQPALAAPAAWPAASLQRALLAPVCVQLAYQLWPPTCPLRPWPRAAWSERVLTWSCECEVEATTNNEGARSHGTRKLVLGSVLLFALLLLREGRLPLCQELGLLRLLRLLCQRLPALCYLLRSWRFLLLPPSLLLRKLLRRRRR